MRVPLIEADRVHEGQATDVDACFDARTGHATAAPARPDSRLIRLPIRIEDGQVTYVYGEPDQANPGASPVTPVAT